MIRLITIDDSKVVHSVLEKVFAGTKVELTHAYDGAEGFESLTKAGPDAFGLVLLDWEMPKLTGIETLKKIRSAGLTVPVIMLTTKNSPSDIELALTSGANEYIMKPFVSDIVLDKVESVLGTKVR